MDEGRKRALLIAASILAARKLAQIDRPCPALDFCIADSIAKAERIMRKIDAQWSKERETTRDLITKRSASHPTPVLVMHSDDDQIVPYADSAPLSAKLLRNRRLKTYKGFPHGMPTTNAEQINSDLLSFLKGAATAAAS